MRSNSLTSVAKRRWLGVFVTLYTLVFIGLVIVLAYKAGLIADDFRFLLPGFPIIDFIYNNDSGRIAHGIAMTTIETLFGEKSVKIFPIIIVLLFMASLAVLFFAIFKKKTAILAGLVVSILAMISFHSFFDFSLFFSAATTHSLTLIYIINLASLLVFYYKANFKFKLYYYIFIIPLCLVGSLLSEMAAILSCFLIVLFMIVTFLRQKHTKSWFSRLVRSIKPLYIIVATTGIVGFLVIYFSPGSSNRRLNNISNSSVLSSLQGALEDYLSMVLHFVTNPVNIAILLCGALIILLLLKTSQYKRFLIPLAIFMLILPIFIFFTTNYSLGYTAMRMYNLTDFFFFFAVCLLIVRVGLFLQERRMLPARNYLLTTSVVLAIIPLGAFIVGDFTNIYRAETARKALLETRKNTIIDNIRTNQNPVTFIPAPLLLQKTEAIDMTYYPQESPRSKWLYGILHKYYAIDRPAVIAGQPQDYCIDQDVLSRFKEVLAKKCGSY